MSKVLWALIGGVGGVLSLALVSLLTKFLNPYGNYIVAIVFSIVGFTLLGSCVIGSIMLASPVSQTTLTRLLIGIIVAGSLAGLIFPWGTFGFYLSFLLLGVTIAFAINGFSIVTLKNVLWILVGLIAGGAIATLWVTAIALWKSSNLNSDLIAVWIPFGLAAYGSTLGLLLSLRNP